MNFLTHRKVAGFAGSMPLYHSISLMVFVKNIVVRIITIIAITIIIAII